MCSELPGQMGVELHHLVEAEDRIGRCSPLAATVGMHAHIGGQHCAQCRHVAAARCRVEGVGELDPSLLFEFEPRPCIAHMVACPRGELTTGGRIALDGGSYLVKPQSKHIMQQEGSAFERREPLHCEQQRECDVFPFFLLHDRIGKPGADISFTLELCRFQLIETKPCDHPAKERLGLADLFAINPHPPDEGLLLHDLGDRYRAQHAIGDTQEARAQRIKDLRCALEAWLRHQAAALAAALAAAGSSHVPKPTESRFQPLMTLIMSVSFTCSSSLNWALSAP